MSFHEDDLRIRGVDPATVSSSQAWWRIAVVGGEHAPGCVQVCDEARRSAGLAGGEVDDDVRFRAKVADTLNRMIDDVGEASLISTLRAAEKPLRIGQLRH